MVVATQPLEDSRPLDQPPQLLLPRQWWLSHEQFEQVCQANPDAVLELSADGQLIVTIPTGGETSARNATLSELLGLAVHSSGLPLKLFGQLGWVSLARWFGLEPRCGFGALGSLAGPES